MQIKAKKLICFLQKAAFSLNMTLIYSADCYCSMRNWLHTYHDHFYRRFKKRLVDDSGQNALHLTFDLSFQRFILKNISYIHQLRITKLELLSRGNLKEKLDSKTNNY